MCKEDIRLARAAVPHSFSGPAVPADGAVLFGVNYNRYSLTAAITFTALATRNINVIIAARIGTTIIPLIGLSNDTPSGHVNIIDVGSVLLEQIVIINKGSDNPVNLYVSDTAFNQEMESV